MKNSSDSKVVEMFKHANMSAKVMSVADAFDMKRGGQLSNLHIAYETWGSLNSDKSNVIVIFTGLSASSHVTSSLSDQAPGWWEAMVGEARQLTLINIMLSVLTRLEVVLAQQVQFHLINKQISHID